MANNGKSNAFYVPQLAMVIVAHPDDIEFGSVGTVARWIKYGAQVSYVLCTSGDVGIADTSLTREQARDIREVEQRRAAEIAGVQEVIFLREPDGTLVNTLDLRKKLVREIRRYKPDVVVTLDPTLVFVSDGYINHPDHRAAGMAALDAVFPAAGQPHVFQELEAEGLTPHKTKKVYVNTWDSHANLWVNITETIDIKVAALAAHESQMKDFKPEMIRDWASQTGKGREMEYAESFRVITLHDEPVNKDNTSEKSPENSE
jgi:LmbE family N-acetylglucosaminyl deacetylase